MSPSVAQHLKSNRGLPAELAPPASPSTINTWLSTRNRKSRIINRNCSFVVGHERKSNECLDLPVAQFLRNPTRNGPGRLAWRQTRCAIGASRHGRRQTKKRPRHRDKGLGNLSKNLHVD